MTDGTVIKVPLHARKFVPCDIAVYVSFKRYRVRPLFILFYNG